MPQWWNKLVQALASASEDFSYIQGVDNPYFGLTPRTPTPTVSIQGAESVRVGESVRLRASGSPWSLDGTYEWVIVAGNGQLSSPNGAVVDLIGQVEGEIQVAVTYTKNSITSDRSSHAVRFYNLSITDWLEIQLLDEQNQPVPNEPYRVILSDGSILEGELDQRGFKRIEKLASGKCKVVFPQRDADWWVPTTDVELPPSPPEKGVPNSPASGTAWLEIQLLDEQNQPVPNEPYRVILSDGSILEGELDQRGFKRIEGLNSGTYKVVFPQRDADWWIPTKEAILPPEN